MNTILQVCLPLPRRLQLRYTSVVLFNYFNVQGLNISGPVLGWSAGKHICNFMSFGKIWTNATFVCQLHSNSARSHPSQTFHSFNQLEGIFFATNWYLAEALSYLALEPTLPGFSGPSAPNVQAAAWKFIPHSSYVHLSSSLLLPCSHTHVATDLAVEAAVGGGRLAWKFTLLMDHTSQVVPPTEPSSQHLASYVLHSAWYNQGCRPIIFADERHLKIEWFRAQSLSAAFKLRLSGAQHIST